MIKSCPGNGVHYTDLLCDQFINGSRQDGHLTEINNKDLYSIITADNSKPAMERTQEEFRGFTYCLDRPTEQCIIYGTGAWNIGEIKKSDAMNKAFEMGKTD